MLPATFFLGCCCTDCTPPAVEALAPVITAEEGLNLTVGPLVVTGSAPFAYQWFRGAPGDTTNPIAGATGPTLTFAPVEPTQAGPYWCRIQNPCGETAASFTLEVTTACIPCTATVTPPAPGPYLAPVTLTAIAAGTAPFTYQWHESIVGPGGPFVPMPAETTDTLTPSGLLAQAWYICVVTNPCGTATTPPVEVQGGVPA